MSGILRSGRFPFSAVASAALAISLAGGFALQPDIALAAQSQVVLSGAQEVPPAHTAASGHGTITVADDGSVRGSVMVTGMDATMAHIHVGAPGTNGRPIIDLENRGGGTWSVPAGARLTSRQMNEYRAGDLYINVHSDQYMGGEIRGQLKP